MPATFTVPPTAVELTTRVPSSNFPKPETYGRRLSYIVSPEEMTAGTWLAVWSSIRRAIYLASATLQPLNCRRKNGTWQETTLYNFGLLTTIPANSLVVDPNDNLFGTIPPQNGLRFSN